MPDLVYTIYVGAPAGRVWQSITDGSDTARYFYGTRVESDWRPGSPVVYTYPDGRVAADGEVLEVEPGRSVRLTFHPRWDAEIEAEGPVEMTWAIEPELGVTRLGVTTSGVRPGSRMATDFAGGIPYIASGLKTVAETDAPMNAGQPPG
jgi:uncharacterized protein YndB with AHSA1/START domain